MTEAEAATLQAGKAELWRRGLAWKYLCDSVSLTKPAAGGQAGWLRALQSGLGHAVWMVARQRGKSFTALAYAASLCASRPGTVVRYAAKTKESARGIVEPNFATILADCPPDCLPRQDGQRGVMAWPNGSLFVWAGTDAETFDRLRGPRSHLILLDEAGFYQDLERVESALLPSLQTTGGQCIYLSTPSESPGHTYISRYRAAAARGRAIVETIHDNPRLGERGVADVLRQEADRLGLSLEQFSETTYYRREYLAEIVTEESRAAVPTWAANAVRCTRAVERRQHFDGYVGIDLGFSDPSAALVAWLDFQTSTLVVEAELELRGKTVAQLADGVKALEREAWGANRFDGTLRWAEKLQNLPDWLAARAHSSAPAQPLLRVGDDDKLVLSELAASHGLAVLPTRKDDKHLAVDALSQLVASGRLAIHPRCVRLLEQLQTTVWNRQRTEWERTERDHGDLLDALVYLVRNVAWNRDPRPPVEHLGLPSARPTSWVTGLMARRVDR